VFAGSGYLVFVFIIFEPAPRSGDRSIQVAKQLFGSIEQVSGSFNANLGLVYEVSRLPAKILCSASKGGGFFEIAPQRGLDIGFAIVCKHATSPHGSEAPQTPARSDQARDRNGPDGSRDAGGGS